MNDRDLPPAPQARSALADGGLPSAPAAPPAVAVPNVSEGRDPRVVAALADACRVPGVSVLDVHSDADHNRSVISLAGDPFALQDALVALAAAAVDHIDLRRQRGVHPRVGALDVAPLVAVREEDAGLARELARGLAERIGEELALPAFLYGDVASDPARTRPRDFRNGGLEALERAMEDGRLAPDAGPHRLHPSAGAVLVGARPPLVALNVWLPEASVTEARAIAARVRQDGGGPPGVRALGLYLPEAGMAQVSMNLEDHRAAPPAAAIAAVRAEAARLGVATGDSELVGLVPREAVGAASPAALRLAGFRPGMVIEAQVPALGRGI